MTDPDPRPCPFCDTRDDAITCIACRGRRFVGPNTKDADRSVACGSCGAKVAIPASAPPIAICAMCASGPRLREHWASMGAALGSVPDVYRSCVWDSPTLYDRVPDLARARDSEDDDMVTPAVLLSWPILVLHGPTGAGKTSLAVALYRSMIDSTSPESDAAIVRRAQRARFVDVRDAVPRSAVLASARRASVLLLDDVGQEAGEGATFQSDERCFAIGEILADRHKRRAQTIVTTDGDPDKWGRTYGAGIARRYWENPEAIVKELRRRR